MPAETVYYAETMYHAGIIMCAAAAVLTVIAVISLRAYKRRLDKRLDAEYGDLTELNG